MKSLLTALLLPLAAAAQAPPVPAPDAPPVPASAPGGASAIDKARAALAAGKPADALQELQQAAKDDPLSPPPRVTLAALLVAAGRGADARAQLEQAAREDPEHPDIHLLNAQFALNEGRTTEALLSAKAAAQYAAAPRWEAEQRQRFQRESRAALAMGLERRQDYAAAAEQLRAILAEQPNSGPTRVRLAAALFYQGKPDEAFAELKSASAADPALAQPELQMADLYASKNDAAKADEWRAKAVAARPDDYRPERATAVALLDRGRIDEALPHIERGMKLDPTGKELLPVKGLWLRYKKQYAEAAGIFEQLHLDSPNNSVYAWNLALALSESPDKEKQRRAVEMAESEARRNGRVAEAFAVLGRCYYQAGQPDQAERVFLQAGQLGALSPDAGYFLARLFVDRNRLTEAAAALQAVLSSTAAFVYRPEAKALLAEIEPKLPAAKK